jgi:para-aminobenzoate synthetase component 2|tara:strand:+ start:1067 stop:1633 length:567 start_codon:yes stop_codon:yes gene_type:complete
MLVMIDNYDSFTYNLVQYFGELGEEVRVFRNDQISLKKIQDMNPDYLVISPGPCSPKEAGISLELIKELKGELPIFGVCLGHQAIAEAFGAKIVKANYPMHGKISVINHDGDYLFKDLEKNLSVTRYHSLVIEPSSLTDDFIVNARTDDGIIMAIQHKTLNISGVQFHPESIMTKQGKKLLQNFLNSK